MSAREQILLTALREIAVGRKRSRNGHQPRLLRDEMVENARRAIAEYEKASADA